jgi:periplasmic divalent cation tolerance protein
LVEQGEGGMPETGIVFMTAADREEAERIARALVEKQLAACVQIVSEIRSLYRWEGRVCDESEILFIAKTTRALFDDLSAEVRRLHSYRVPEIVFVPIAAADHAYVRWITDSTQPAPCA